MDPWVWTFLLLLLGFALICLEVFIPSAGLLGLGGGLMYGAHRMITKDK